MNQDGIAEPLVAKGNSDKRGLGEDEEDWRVRGKEAVAGNSINLYSSNVGRSAGSLILSIHCLTASYTYDNQLGLTPRRPTVDTIAWPGATRNTLGVIPL